MKRTILSGLLGIARRALLVPAVLGGLLVSLLGSCSGSPRLTAEAAEAGIRAALVRAAQRHPDRSGASVLVHSDRLGIHALVRADPAAPDAFHVASVGKLFTAVLVGRLIDQGITDFDSPVAPLLEPGLLDGLFVVDGRDRQGEVTVAHLLAHTSGAADYYADPAAGGRPVSRLIVEQPERAWTPRDLLAFAREEQAAVAVPGARFHYSDTGYIVLGLLAAELSGLPFERLLAQEILEPLGMNRTWMPHRGQPGAGNESIRAAWLQGTEVSRFASITADWAGGGIASTEEDLLRFQRALWAGTLVSPATLAAMRQFDGVFQKGIHYGKGLMELRFEEFFFLLKGYPRMAGHMGVLGTQLFYEPDRDLHVILTLGSDAAVEDSVKLLIRILGIVRRMGPLRAPRPS